jgi:hypothetical protein
MTTTTTTIPTYLFQQPAANTNGSRGPAESRTRRSWPLFGVAAAVFGGVATLLPSKVNMQPDTHQTSAAVVATLHRWPYQVAVVAGIIAVGCFLVAASGWRRWAAERAPDSLAAETIGKAFGATAGAMMIAFGMLGSLAVYLHGGINQHMFAHQGLYSVYMFVDFGPYVAWWGVTVAAAALAVVAFRNHAVPRWMGVASVAAVFIAVAPLVLTGLPGMPGAIGPFWLAVISLGMACHVRSV